MDDRKARIVVIGTYWGAFGENFKQWLWSCERNETIDFLVVTDNEWVDLPKNVSFLKKNFEQFRDLASTKLGKAICLERVYKICDYKPLYGLILEDYIKEYDYWGHCDFDMIFGDIRSYLVRYGLSQYDKFLPLGHLCFYRNTEECKKRYNLLVNNKCLFETMSSTKENICFDEIGINQIYETYHFPYFKEKIFADIAIHRSRFLVGGDLDVRHQVFGWKDGKVFQVFWNEEAKKVEYREYIYIHFQRRKMPSHLKNVKSNFWITKSGVYPWRDDEDIDIALMEKYNKYPGRIKEWEEIQERKLRIVLYRFMLMIINLFHLDKSRWNNILGRVNPYWGPRVDRL